MSLYMCLPCLLVSTYIHADTMGIDSVFYPYLGKFMFLLSINGNSFLSGILYIYGLLVPEIFVVFHCFHFYNTKADFNYL